VRFISQHQHRCYCLYGPCRFFYIISFAEFTVFQWSAVPNALLFIGATFSTSKREWMLIGLFLISDWHFPSLCKLSPSICKLSPSNVSTINICGYAWCEPRPLNTGSMDDDIFAQSCCRVRYRRKRGETETHWKCTVSLTLTVTIYLFKDNKVSQFSMNIKTWNYNASTVLNIPTHPPGKAQKPDIVFLFYEYQ